MMIVQTMSYVTTNSVFQKTRLVIFLTVGQFQNLLCFKFVEKLISKTVGRYIIYHFYWEMPGWFVCQFNLFSCFFFFFSDYSGKHIDANCCC